MSLARELKWDLDRIAARADTSSSRGLHHLLQGEALQGMGIGGSGHGVAGNAVILFVLTWCIRISVLVCGSVAGCFLPCTELFEWVALQGI